MKKKDFIAVIFIAFLALKPLAQTNLVANGSFETYTNCASMYNTGSPDVISYAVGWFSSNYNPDYYNACSSQTTGVSIPKNNTGFQYPYDGQAYCGFALYGNNGSGRESLSSQLSTPLTIGQRYYVSLRVNLIDAATYAAWGIDKIGVLFSTQKYDLSNPTPIKNYAQVYTTTIIADSVNWTLIKGSFIADSLYKYINVSNFFDLTHTDTSHLNPNANYSLVTSGGAMSYYLVDDIRVSTDSLFGLGYVGIKEIADIESKIKLYPNPTHDELSFILDNDPAPEAIEWRIVNALGVELKNGKMESNTQTLDLSELLPGIYFLQIRDREHLITTKKIIKE
ncbi:MAG: T9SS type A sorting domain-containing protein [Bacteroidia bacterium]